MTKTDALNTRQKAERIVPMAWIYLSIAGIFEIVWAVSMKYSQGFQKGSPTAIMVFGMLMSMIFLTYAVKSLPIGSAYAVWTGIGAAGTALLGILLFQESGNPLRLFFIMVIIIGILGLRMTASNG